MDEEYVKLPCPKCGCPIKCPQEQCLRFINSQQVTAPATCHTCGAEREWTKEQVVAHMKETEW